MGWEGAESNLHQGSTHVSNGGGFIAISKWALSELRSHGYDIARVNYIRVAKQTNTRKAFPNNSDIQRSWECRDLAIIC